ncbi:TatD family deoxyribonuclease [SAR202 cluster bacterium AD-804-J14_MRT_500m]|nr:TatD family deoxyribonuclease [SAR202 cluster bacterium AD-804-J14_MRT_500m]
MPKLIDSHTHIDHFPPSEISDVLCRAIDADVGLVICAGTTLQSSSHCASLSIQYPIVYAGVGLHPMNLEHPIDDDTYSSLESLIANNRKVICISEIGLDFQSTSPSRDLQYQALRQQIGLAREHRLPIIFHSRESHPEIMQMLLNERAFEVGGVMHYFQADLDIAKTAINLGFLVSLAKPLLRLPELQQVTRDLPIDHIVLETDAVPQPWKKHRKNWTEPSHVRFVAEKVAEIKGLTLDQVIKTTTDNLLRSLKLDHSFLTTR